MYKFLIAGIALVLLLGSCSIQEEIDLAIAEKGAYKLDVDMSQMIDMMKSMSGDGKLPDSTANKVTDTTFSLSPMIDSSGGNFTAAEKAYFYNGHMHMQMNMPENKMNIKLTFPVKDAADLKKFFAVYDKVDSLNKIKKQQAKAQEEEGETDGSYVKRSKRPPPYINGVIYL